LNVGEKAAFLRSELIEFIPPTNNEEQLKVICMDDVKQEPVSWLWEPNIPLGKKTIIQGDPGDGKTFLAVQLAAHVTCGELMPFGRDVFQEKPANVIFQTAEDGLGDTVKKRLTDAKADCKRVFVIDEAENALTLDDSRLPVAMARLRPKLVVIDPVQAYLGAGVDMHRANEIRPVMMRLGMLAAKFQCAIVLIGHLNKGAGSKSLYRGLGSIDLTAAARSVLVVGRVPESKYRRAIVQVKSSLAPVGDTILFDLDPTCGFLWVGTSDLSADDILNYRCSVERSAPERDEVEGFLKELLADGALSSGEVWAAVKANGFSEATVNRAKKQLGIESVKAKGDGGQWFWALKGYPAYRAREGDTLPS
jgi:RecA/RadA recombinase